jgi:hypothetical protein
MNGQNVSNQSVFMLMLILNIVQGINYTNIAEHLIKAIITALIWLVFKIAADVISKKMDLKKNPEAKENGK